MQVCVDDPELISELQPLPDDVEVVFWDGLTLPPPPAAMATQFWALRRLTVRDEAFGRAAAALPALQVIQVVSAGVDPFLAHVPAGVRLCDGTGLYGASVAELAMAATLALVRDLPQFSDSMRAGEWERHPTSTLAGKSVVIIGAGDIGTAVAARMRAFEAEPVLVGRRAREGVFGPADIPGLVAQSDVVVLAMPLTPETTGLVDRAFLAGMPDGSILVNVSRGAAVDTDALTAEVLSGRLRAALDTFDPEPLPADHPLRHSRNVVLTPHVGGNVDGIDARAAILIREQIARLHGGRPLVNVVHGD